MNLRIYTLESDPDWASKIAPDINPVPSDDYPYYNTPSGLMAVNSASKEMAGGLISNDKKLPTDFTPTFFGMDVAYILSRADLPHLGRNELDVKITLVNGVKDSSGNPTLPNQANGSAQQNFSENGMWQLDPTGKAWVDSGYAPGIPQPEILNTMQFRYWADLSKELWSVTGLCANHGVPFIPGSLFQNIPLIKTTWTEGVHPQLQTECTGVPWFLRVLYAKVRVFAADEPVPYGTMNL